MRGGSPLAEAVKPSQPLHGRFCVSPRSRKLFQFVINGGESAEREKDVAMGAADDQSGDVEASMQRRQRVDEAAALKAVEGGLEIAAVEEVDEGVGVADGTIEGDLAEVLFEGARSLGDRLRVKVLEKALGWDGDRGGEGRQDTF